MLAGRTIIVGALQPQFVQHGLKGLSAPAHIAGGPASGTRPAGPRKVGVVGIQLLLDHPGCKAQSLTPDGGLHRLEIDRRGGFPTYQPLNLFGEVVRQSFGDCGFF